MAPGGGSQRRSESHARFRRTSCHYGRGERRSNGAMQARRRPGSSGFLVRATWPRDVRQLRPLFRELSCHSPRFRGAQSLYVSRRLPSVNITLDGGIRLYIDPCPWVHEKWLIVTSASTEIPEQISASVLEQQETEGFDRSGREREPWLIV